MRARSQLKSKSFAPRAGLQQRKPQRAPSRLLWEPRPAAKAGSRPAQKQKLRPEGGPPTRKPQRAPSAFCGSRDPRRTRACGRLKSKASPGGRGSYRKHDAHRAAFCGNRDPRRMGACGPLKKQKLRPERGAPTKKAKARTEPLVGSTPRQLPDPRKTKPRARRGLSSSRPASGRACPRRLYQALIRDLYSPVRVSISIESPISQKAETCSSAPFFRRAVFMTLPEVSPRTDGSV